MSVSEIDKTIWQGRIDPEPNSERWHQKVKPFISNSESGWQNRAEKGTVLLGFCCDEGVRRNHGRIGAKQAPDAIRKALANLTWHGTKPVYDAGNVYCDDSDLEAAQQKLAKAIGDPLYDEHLPVILGGGHEVAFASWMGILYHLYFVTHFKGPGTEPNIGIINFDAHFDLRTPEFLDTPCEGWDWIPGIPRTKGHSGTPFAQISHACGKNGVIKFHYAALGISRANNTQALFDKAKELNTWVVEDKEINLNTLPAISEQLKNWMQDKRDIYLSFDIDVLPAYQAPGCSAPAALGVELSLLLPLIAQIKQSGKLMLADIAEVNPRFDSDNRTAKVAARIVHLLHGDE